jgi:spore germination protein PD
MINLHVTNRELCVCNVKIGGITSSSLFLIGDAETLTLASLFDTPPEAVLIGPFVPLSLS